MAGELVGVTVTTMKVIALLRHGSHANKCALHKHRGISLTD